MATVSLKKRRRHNTARLFFRTCILTLGFVALLTLVLNTANRMFRSRLIRSYKSRGVVAGREVGETFDKMNLLPSETSSLRYLSSLSEYLLSFRRVMLGDDAARSYGGNGRVRLHELARFASDSAEEDDNDRIYDKLSSPISKNFFWIKRNSGGKPFAGKFKRDESSILGANKEDLSNDGAIDSFYRKYGDEVTTFDNNKNKKNRNIVKTTKSKDGLEAGDILDGVRNVSLEDIIKMASSSTSSSSSSSPIADSSAVNFPFENDEEINDDLKVAKSDPDFVRSDSERLNSKRRNSELSTFERSVADSVVSQHRKRFKFSMNSRRDERSREEGENEREGERARESAWKVSREGVKQEREEFADIERNPESEERVELDELEEALEGVSKFDERGGYKEGNKKEEYKEESVPVSTNSGGNIYSVSDPQRSWNDSLSGSPDGMDAVSAGRQVSEPAGKNEEWAEEESAELELLGTAGASKLRKRSKSNFGTVNSGGEHQQQLQQQPRQQKQEKKGPVKGDLVSSGFEGLREGSEGATAGAAGELQRLSANAIQKKTKKSKTKKNKKQSPYIIFYRILGNDMPPLQSVGQLRSNLKFTLKHEPNFKHCEKRWMLNRIVNATEKTLIVELLKRYKYGDHQILDSPFDLERVISSANSSNPVGWNNLLVEKEEERERLQALGARIRDYTALNTGRNEALTDGFAAGARWVMCFDGNQFLTQQSYDRILRLARQADRTEELKYIETPMLRLSRKQHPNWLHANSSIEQIFNHTEGRMEEGQIIFRNDSTERFNENMAYSLGPKLELLEKVCGFNSTQCLCHDTIWWWRIRTLRGVTRRAQMCGLTVRMFNFPEAPAKEKRGHFMTGQQRRNLRTECAERFIAMVDGMIEERRRKLRLAGGEEAIANATSHVAANENGERRNGLYFQNHQNS